MSAPGFEGELYNDGCYIVDDDGHVATAENREFAAAIVRVVAHHEELVAALREIVVTFGSREGSTIVAARNVLAKLNGGAA